MKIREQIGMKAGRRGKPRRKKIRSEDQDHISDGSCARSKMEGEEVNVAAKIYNGERSDVRSKVWAGSLAVDGGVQSSKIYYRTRKQAELQKKKKKGKGYIAFLL